MRAKLSFIIKATVLSAIILTTTVVPNNFISNNVVTEAATKVKLNYTKKTIKKDEILKLKMIGTKKKVKWKTSDSTIAGLLSAGVVQGFRPGTAKITATVDGKKYVCKVTVTETYGTVSGNVTYHYNQYRGYVANTGSIVFLIPKGRYYYSMNVTDEKLDGISDTNLRYLSSSTKNKLKNLGIYATKVDGNGNFTISHVPTEEYFVYIISGQTSTQGWFDSYNESTSDASDDYYQSIVNNTLLSLLDDRLGFLLAKAAGYNAYASDLDVEVYENEISTVTYEFPYTYI